MKINKYIILSHLQDILTDEAYAIETFLNNEWKEVHLYTGRAFRRGAV